MPAVPSGTEVIPHDAGTFGDRSQGRGAAPDCSPPGPLQGAVGAAGAVEPVQRPNVLIRELKVEDLRVSCTIAGRPLTKDEWEELLPDRRYEPACQ